MGQSEASFPITNRQTAAVLSGPNKDFKYVVSVNVSAPITTKINKHFYVTNPPQSWIDFKNAQGNEENEVQYADIDPAVKKHEGVGPSDLTTGSHYKYWHVTVVAKGIDAPTPKGDAKEDVEDYVANPTISLADYDAAVRDLLLNTHWLGWKEPLKDNEPEPSPYLNGKVIDFTYPDRD
jgi:hypothetical protein